jgi:hypothetical protein
MVRLRPPVSLAMEFGTAGPELVTDPELEDDLRLAERQSRLEREGYRAELDDLVAEYESLLGEARAAEDAARERALVRAETVKREYAEAKPAHDAEATMLATVLVIRALREPGDGVPAPEAAEAPVRERLADSDLDDRRTEDYLRAAHATLAIDDPDPLAWVPAEELPDRTLPQNPTPDDGDPTWELPTPEPTASDEVMREIAEGELDPDDLDETL